MDHRHAKRVDVKLDVLIYSQGVPVAAGKTRNIASGGTFVESDYRPKNRHLYVDLAFVACDETETGVYHVKGLIVHSTPQGIGLMIDGFDPESRLPIQMLNIRRSEPDRGRLL
jgi:hypothetical protein